jgi:hypothetical protein
VANGDVPDTDFREREDVPDPRDDEDDEDADEMVEGTDLGPLSARIRRARQRLALERTKSGARQLRRKSQRRQARQRIAERASPLTSRVEAARDEAAAAREEARGLAGDLGVGGGGDDGGDDDDAGGDAGEADAGGGRTLTVDFRPDALPGDNRWFVSGPTAGFGAFKTKQEATSTARTILENNSLYTELQIETRDGATQRQITTDGGEGDDTTTTDTDDTADDDAGLLAALGGRLSDADEALRGIDTDGDGIAEFEAVDTDGDGRVDTFQAVDAVAGAREDAAAVQTGEAVGPLADAPDAMAIEGVATRERRGLPGLDGFDDIEPPVGEVEDDLTELFEGGIEEDLGLSEPIEDQQRGSGGLF